MLPKGTKRTLKNNPSHYYVKLKNEDFAWWRLEDLEKNEDKRMMVRLTDEMVMFETYFVLDYPKQM